MRIMTLGAGAVGGYFAGRLAQSGADVTFLVRERRKAQLAERGLEIRSALGDYTGPVKALTPAEIDAPADVVFVACKAYDLASAIEAIGPAVGDDTAILPLLNGLAHIEVLNAAFGRHRVLGGVAKIAATLTADGAIQHLNDWRYLTFGEQDGSSSARVVALKAAFDRTSVLATISPAIMQAMWEKIVHLATAAGVTCLMRANVGEIARAPGGAELMMRFLDANAAIAANEGHPPSEAFMAEYRALFSDQGSGYTASMLRDIERGGPVEADHIIGYMLRRARAHGLDDTLHAIAYTHLKSYEERRAAGRL
jgi:2-dehydropantoate 2-reductase